MTVVIWVILVVIGLCVLSVLGAWVAAEKERAPGEGAVLGLLFGPLGVLIEALLPNGAPAPRKRFVPHRRRRSEGYRFDDDEEPGAEPDALRIVDPGAPAPAEPPAAYETEAGVVRWCCACGKPREAPARLAGKIAPCPRCKARTIVPAAG